MTITKNNEKNGIEIKFEKKPSTEILKAIKSAGFRYSPKQKIWYAKQTDTDEILNFIEKLKVDYSNELNADTAQNETETEKREAKPYDLWEQTRTEGIENNLEKTGYYHKTKEIAAAIRKHLRDRFPKCKWSVRKEDHNSISVNLIESPFALDSDELKAIVHYAAEYAKSYNYDNSDSMADYFDVNFYGVYESSIVSSYSYTQREATTEELVLSENFKKAKAEWEKQEQEREAKEFEEYCKQQEIEKQKQEKVNAERKAKHKLIEANAKIKDNVSYFVLNCDETDTSKNDKLKDYTDGDNSKKETNHYRQNCKISREVYFDTETYEMFSNQLLDDYSFLAGMGGSNTDDLRINSMTDFYQMQKEERETVEWYSYNCVAVFCNSKLKFIIDPQGYSYARYVFFVDNASEIVSEYKTFLGIITEEAEENRKQAEILMKAALEIIDNNNMAESFEKENIMNEQKKTFINLMSDWIRENNFNLNKNVVRAIDKECAKSLMYSLLYNYNSVQKQFERANFKPEQKFTLIRFSDFGGLSIIRGYFKSYKIKPYAQYNNNVQLVYKLKGKRSDDILNLHSDCLIYNGWLPDIPETLLWDINKNGNVITKSSKFSSFDKKQYDITLEYYKENLNFEPVINTFNF